MNISILVARILSIIYLSTGLAILIKTIDFNKIIEDFEKSSALTFCAGSIGIVVGLILLNFHNIWTNNWTTLITIINWLFLLGGIIVVVYPKSISLKNKLLSSSNLLGLLITVIGLIFGYFGFFK